MSNQGFEFELDFTPVATRKFTYSFNVIGSTNKNKFISFSNSNYIGEDYYDEAAVEGPFLGIIFSVLKWDSCGQLLHVALCRYK